MPVVLRRDIDLPRSGRRVILVTLNRPAKLNCFNKELCYLLAQIFHDIAGEAEKDDVAAVILAGEGSSFCAGADLSGPPNPLSQSSDLPHHLKNNPVHQMGKVTVPVIGAVSGHCITGGFELALACDLLVGDKTTSFRDTHVKFGLAPCWGLSQRLQRRVGQGRASLASYTARRIDTNTAAQWGLLDDVAPEGKSALEKALEVADEIGLNDATMVVRYKRALRDGGEMDLAQGLIRERQLGIAHYLETVGDGRTFEGAKEYIKDETRLRSKL